MTWTEVSSTEQYIDSDSKSAWYSSSIDCPETWSTLCGLDSSSDLQASELANKLLLSVHIVNYEVFILLTIRRKTNLIRWQACACYLQKKEIRERNKKRWGGQKGIWPASTPAMDGQLVSKPTKFEQCI